MSPLDLGSGWLAQRHVFVRGAESRVRHLEPPGGCRQPGGAARPAGSVVPAAGDSTESGDENGVGGAYRHLHLLGARWATGCKHVLRACMHA